MRLIKLFGIFGMATVKSKGYRCINNHKGIFFALKIEFIRHICVITKIKPQVSISNIKLLLHFILLKFSFIFHVVCIKKYAVKYENNKKNIA